MKPAVIYSRVSSVSDRQNTERQVSDLNNYAKKNDFQVIKEFSENISGAKKNEERTVLMECIDFCVTNNIDTLLCYCAIHPMTATLEEYPCQYVTTQNKVEYQSYF